MRNIYKMMLLQQRQEDRGIFCKAYLRHYSDVYFYIILTSLHGSITLEGTATLMNEL